MHKDKFIFAQLTRFLDRNHFNYLIKKYEGDKYIKRYTCWNQPLTIIFGQRSNQEGLRDQVVAMEAYAGKLYHLGIVNIGRCNNAKMQVLPLQYRRAYATLFRLYVCEIYLIFNLVHF